MKKLPVGIQSFRRIIEDGYVYADKTREIHELVTGGQYYFLSRPRRFGKSLLIDTIAKLFSGDRTLFEGLWIAGAESDWGFEAHPVIHLDMTQFSLASPESLEADLVTKLGKMAEAEGLGKLSGSPQMCFQTLIEGLAATSGRCVVVLIDEYDKPIVDYLHDTVMAERMRFTLGNFYGVLKGQDANLRFVLLTGITKFAKLSLFSKLNNFSDITLNRRYAAICGITEQDFDRLLAERIPQYIREQKAIGFPDGDRSPAEIRKDIFDWYNGFSWDGTTRLFNPFSILSFFRDLKFSNYWFATGIPAYQMRHFKQRPWEYAQVQGEVITEAVLDSHNIEDAPLASLLFQTGFLTVRRLFPDRPESYALGFPNQEVSESFARLFLATLADVPDPLSVSFAREMTAALDTGEPKRIAAPLSGLYASLPYELHIQAERAF
jgi:hypothetical protein